MFFPRKTSDLHCLHKTRWSFLPFLKMLGGQATQYMGWHVFLTSCSHKDVTSATASETQLIMWGNKAKTRVWLMLQNYLYHWG